MLQKSVVVRLGLVSFLADLSSEMLYPVTPLFLSGVLGASMAQIGLIEGLAEAGASLLKTVAGRWSDRIGRRRPFIVAGYFLATISKPLIGSAASWAQVLCFRALDRAGKGLRTAPRDALLADAAGQRELGSAFGLHRAMDTAGASIGPLLALLYLRTWPESLRPLFFWAVIPGLLSVALAMSLPEAPRATPVQAPAPAASLPPGFRRFLRIWTCFALANSTDAFLLLRAGELGFDSTGIVLLYCAYNCFYAAFSPAFGRLSDRLGRRQVLILGFLLFAGVYTGMALATAPWQLWVLFALYGLYSAGTEGVGKAYAVELVPRNVRAGALGVLGTRVGLCTLVASGAGGFLWDRLGSSATFLYGAAGALIAALLLVLVPPPPARVVA